MTPLNLAEIRNCVAHGNRAAALSVLRTAINQQKIVARDGVELMLAVRQGSPDVVADAVKAMEWGLSGAYRFVPKAVYDVD
jgi:hypothetical protein